MICHSYIDNFKKIWTISKTCKGELSPLWKAFIPNSFLWDTGGTGLGASWWSVTHPTDLIRASSYGQQCRSHWKKNLQQLLDLLTSSMVIHPPVNSGESEEKPVGLKCRDTMPFPLFCLSVVGFFPFNITVFLLHLVMSWAQFPGLPFQTCQQGRCRIPARQAGAECGCSPKVSSSTLSSPWIPSWQISGLRLN